MSEKLIVRVDLPMFIVILQEDVRRATKAVDMIEKGGVWSDPGLWTDAEQHLADAQYRIEQLRDHLKVVCGRALPKQTTAVAS